MTINLTTTELTDLVEGKMEKMGLVGNYKITFNKRNGNQIDTSIEIINETNNGPTGADGYLYPSDATESSIDSLIK